MISDNVFNAVASKFLGYEPLFDSLLNENYKTSSYPPYNLIKDGDRYKIEVSISGFSPEEIEVKTKENVLYISSEKLKDTEQTEESYLHKGIAQRGFNLSYKLNQLKVLEDISIKNGILTVTLEKIIPEEQKEITYKIQT
jgi:molecular chaperone IbpA